MSDAAMSLKLVHVANQIGAFFKSKDAARAKIAEHLTSGPFTFGSRNKNKMVAERQKYRRRHHWLERRAVKRAP